MKARIMALAAFLGASPVMAVDGVVEINQARAEAGGVTASDAPGFPVTIDTRGSYRLTSNLEVSNANTSAIGILSEDVKLDLNGFTVFGITSCSGIPNVCSNTGTGVGISSGFSNVTVVNGTVRGMGSNGVSLSAESYVVDVQAINNGGVGIWAENGRIRDCLAHRNGGNGIRLGPGSSVMRSSITWNSSVGIDANDTSIVISENSVYRNDDDGIVVGQGCVVVRNAIRSNTAFGIEFFDASSGYVGNVLRSNNGGNANAQVSDGTQIGTNFCGLNTSCP